MKLSIEIIEHLHAGLDGAASGFGHERPEEELLTVRRDVRVVAVEGVPGAQDCPASAERLGGVVVETAHIGAHSGNLIEGGELHVLFDRDAVLFP